MLKSTWALFRHEDNRPAGHRSLALARDDKFLKNSDAFRPSHDRTLFILAGLFERCELARLFLLRVRSFF